MPRCFKFPEHVNPLVHLEDPRYQAAEHVYGRALCLILLYDLGTQRRAIETSEPPTCFRCVAAEGIRKHEAS